MMEWNKEEEAELLCMVAQNKKYKEMAQILERTESSIRNKIKSINIRTKNQKRREIKSIKKQINALTERSDILSQEILADS